jgi:hypothetical protein
MAGIQEVRSKPIPIMLDKQRHLKFDLNAFAEIEELYGSVDRAMDALEKGSIKALRAMLWAGLIHEELDDNGNPTITPRQVGSLINVADLPMLTEKIGEAMNLDLGEDEEAKDKVPLART